MTDHILNLLKSAQKSMEQSRYSEARMSIHQAILLRQREAQDRSQRVEPMKVML